MSEVILNSCVEFIASLSFPQAKPLNLLVEPRQHVHLSRWLIKTSSNSSSLVSWILQTFMIHFLLHHRRKRASHCLDEPMEYSASPVCAGTRVHKLSTTSYEIHSYQVLGIIIFFPLLHRPSVVRKECTTWIKRQSYLAIYSKCETLPSRQKRQEEVRACAREEIIERRGLRCKLRRFNGKSY